MPCQCLETCIKVHEVLKVRDHGFFPTFQVLSKKKRIELCCFHRNRLTSSTAFHRKSLKSLPLSYKKRKIKHWVIKKLKTGVKIFKMKYFLISVFVNKENRAGASCKHFTQLALIIEPVGSSTS
uniref:Uncharacterized protein n=1 Tax=Cacopsylla melanoneura TaxID=428564 RepID=A0A8D8Z3W0_9HEMI